MFNALLLLAALFTCNGIQCALLLNDEYTKSNMKITWTIAQFVAAVICIILSIGFTLAKVS